MRTLSIILGDLKAARELLNACPSDQTAQSWVEEFRKELDTRWAYDHPVAARPTRMATVTLNDGSVVDYASWVASRSDDGWREQD